MGRMNEYDGGFSNMSISNKTFFTKIVLLGLISLSLQPHRIINCAERSGGLFGWSGLVAAGVTAVTTYILSKRIETSKAWEDIQRRLRKGECSAGLLADTLKYGLDAEASELVEKIDLKEFHVPIGCNQNVFTLALSKSKFDLAKRMLDRFPKLQSSGSDSEGSETEAAPKDKLLKCIIFPDYAPELRGRGSLLEVIARRGDQDLTAFERNRAQFLIQHNIAHCNRELADHIDFFKRILPGQLLVRSS